MVTTIQIKDETLSKLKSLKEYSRESYDEVLNKLMDESESEILTEQDIKDIKEGLEDIRRGKIYSLESVAKELRIKLD